MRMQLRRATQVIIMATAMALGFGRTSGAADDPANVVKYRQTMMKTQEGHLLEIVAILKGEVSFNSHLVPHAEANKAIGEMVGDLFPPGSVTPESRASPKIWQNWDKFQEAVGLLRSETAKLAEVAASGDLGAVGAQLGNVGKACGNCHNQFRLKKE